MTIDDLAKLLESNVAPTKLFGNNPTKTYLTYAKIAHPDTNIGNETKAKRVFQLLEEKWKLFNNPTKKITINSGKAIYEIGEVFARGDLSDLYLTTDEKYLLKVARRQEPAFANEIKFIDQIRNSATSKNKGDSILHFFPSYFDTFRIRGNRNVTVFRAKDNLFTFDQVRQKYPALDERDFAWMFNRLLTVLGYLHQKNIIHGAVTPKHCLIEPKKHGFLLVDYTMSVENGNPLKMISAEFESFYPPEVFKKQPATPATDIYMAAKCGLWMIDNKPGKINNFLSTCLAKSPQSRPQDAWELHTEFGELLERLFGPKKFREFNMV